jgi:5-(carboxyamino)imidazole ribonucleotide mutase
MKKQALVAIIMGSDSDWPIMKAAAQMLADLDIAYTAQVVSAHRTPDLMFSFAETAAKKGYQVIIAGAGGAAHLPGMVASITTLPVIGVPVPLTQLEGLDSLLSIVQMPAGVPVATVGIGNAKNAGLLAARIIASAGDDFGTEITAKLDKFQVDMRQTAIDKGDALKALLEKLATND